MSEVDARVVSVGLRRHRIVSTSQLRTLGLDSAAVQRRTQDGRLTRLHRGVYLVGPGKPTREGRWLAAVVALLPDAHLSFRSSGAFHGLGIGEGSATDVLIPRRGASRPNIHVHSTRTLHPDDVTEINHIPVTTIERTFVDLADELVLSRLKQGLERAERRQAVDYGKLRGVAERNQGRRGFSLVQALLAYNPRPAAECHEGLEVAFLELITTAGLPMYRRNVLVAGEEVDAYWPEANLAVELQSWTYHSDPAAFERDHAKAARLKRAGVELLALTHRQVTREGAWVVETIAALAARADAGRAEAA